MVWPTFGSRTAKEQNKTSAISTPYMSEGLDDLGNVTLDSGNFLLFRFASGQARRNDIYVGIGQTMRRRRHGRGVVVETQGVKGEGRRGDIPHPAN